MSTRTLNAPLVYQGQRRQIDARTVELACTLADKSIGVRFTAAAPLDQFSLDQIIDEAICCGSIHELRTELAPLNISVSLS